MIEVKRSKMKFFKRNTIANIIMLVRLMLGLYSGLSANIFFAVLARIYCICFVTLAVYIRYYVQESYPAPMKNFITLVCKFLVYIVSAVVSILSNGENFYDYLHGMDNTASKSMLKRRKPDLLISLIIFILVILLHTFCFLYITNGIHDNICLKCYFFAITLMYMANSLNNMARIMMFEILWDRMKSLRIKMGENLNFLESMRDEEAELQISKLEEYLKIYSSLLDNLKNAGHASKLMIVINLPFYFIYVVSVLMEFTKYGSVNVSMEYIIDGTLNTVLPLVPAVLAELVTMQVEKIKIHLNRQLLVCSHNALRDRTCDALKFLELRPFKYTVWRVFSLDVSLLLAVISLCTTYTIVVIQFSHVFG